MDPTYNLRQMMLSRLLRAAGLAGHAAPALAAAACGGKVIVDGVAEGSGGAGGTGRPFLVGAEAKTASPERADRGWALVGLAIEVEGVEPPPPSEVSPTSMSADHRAALARAWEADGLLEHASIAAFSRFALELLAVGAPPDLIAAASQAAIDEVRHARLCFALAQRYGGETIAPTPFPFGGSVSVSGSLVALAAATAREGCIGETLSAALAAEQLARATDPAVRRALGTITEDESSHAELAWRTVAWAIEHGGEEVRAAVEVVFLEPDRHLPSIAAALDLPAGALAAHGRLSPAEARAALIRAVDDVIRPCAQALCERTAPTIPPALSRSA